MKIQYRTFAIAAFVGLTVFASCQKKDETHHTVTVSAPTDGATFAVGDTISISGTVNDETELTQASIEVSNGDTGALLYTKNQTVTGKSATITATYVANVASGTHLQILIEGYDASENSYGEHAHITIN